MLVVDAFQVVQRDGILTLPRTGLDAFFADFRRALDVDDAGEVDDLVHGHQVVVEVEVDRVFGLVQDVHVAHDGCEDEAVGEEGAFGDADAPAGHAAVLGPLVEAAHEGVDLEGESPAFGLVVVESEQVDVALIAHLLPLGQRLIQDGQLGEGLADDLEDCRFAASDVALDRDESWLSVGHFGGTAPDQIYYKRKHSLSHLTPPLHYAHPQEYEPYHFGNFALSFLNVCSFLNIDDASPTTVTQEKLRNGQKGRK